MPLKSKRDKNIHVIDQHLVQSSSERLPLPADGSGCSDLPRHYMERKNLNWRSPQIPPELREHHRRGGEKIIGIRGHGEHRPPNQLSGAHMDSQRLKHRACQGLHQVLCAYIVAVRMVHLWDS